MLPDGWKKPTVEDCADLLTGHAFRSEDYVEARESTVRLLRGDNIIQGSLRWDDAKHWATPYAEALKRYEMQAGDIVLAMDRPIVNSGLKCSVVRQQDLPSLMVQRVARLRAKKDFDQGYLAHVLQTHRFIEHLRGQKTETAVPHISPNDVREFEFPCPVNPDEQRRIAQILSTWDQAIADAEKVVANSQRQRLGLTQTLISDRCRQARGMPTLHREHASAIFLPRSIRRNFGLELLSVMQDVGVVPRSSLDRKVVMPEGSPDGYKLVEPGDFVISLRSFEGGLEYSRFRGLVSPAYTVLTPAKSIVDDFYRHYFKSREFVGRLAVAVIGIRDGKQVSYDDFEFLKLPSPTIEEQEAIANTLNAAERVVNQHETYLQLLRQEKSALMSQLMTGKRRVKLPEAATEVQA